VLAKESRRTGKTHAKKENGGATAKGFGQGMPLPLQESRMLEGGGKGGGGISPQRGRGEKEDIQKNGEEKESKVVPRGWKRSTPRRRRETWAK